MAKKKSNKQRLSARKQEERHGISPFTYVALAVVVVLIGALSAVYLVNTPDPNRKPTLTPVPTVAVPTPVLSVPGNGSVVTTADGLKYEDLYIGTGRVAQTGDTVTVMYTGTVNGVKFESTYDSGNPFTFTLGKGQVIKGWEEGVVGMKVGGTRRLTIPPELGYGAQGHGSSIPPNATITFDIGLEGIQ